MKKRKKLIKRIGAVLCALVVAVSSMGLCVPYFASESGYDSIISLASQYGIELSQSSFIDDYKYIAFTSGVDNKLSIRGYCDDDLYFTYYVNSGQNKYMYKLIVGETYFNNNAGTKFNSHYLVSIGKLDGQIYERVDDDIICAYGGTCEILYSDYDCFNSNGGGWGGFEIYDVFRPADSVDFGKYNSALGYLQNVKHNVVFDDVPLGENVAETFTERWYYDSLSTTGVDLTSGDYVIRYYQEKWIVTGYGENDVVKKSDRYMLGDYIVQNGYIETYSESVESTLAGQGYVEPSIFDLLWNKFVTTHYYFQIVNAKTNEVGGLLHVYLTDDNGKFGVEHIGETLDNEGNYDDGGYKDFIDEDKITTDDVEQGFDDLENGSNVDFGTIDGVDEFGVTLESFASQVSNVTGGVNALLLSMPPWILGLLGVSFLLLIVGIIFKIV